jgi:hypothetical protein
MRPDPVAPLFAGGHRLPKLDKPADRGLSRLHIHFAVDQALESALGPGSFLASRLHFEEKTLSSSDPALGSRRKEPESP